MRGIREEGARERLRKFRKGGSRARGRRKKGVIGERCKVGMDFIQVD